MYLAVDIGGSKTLLAVFSEDGEVIAQHKIPTNKDYAGFLQDIKQVLSAEFKEYSFNYCCCAVPGRIDRKQGLAIRLGNLPWQNERIVEDLKKLLNGIPVLIENDANLGGLSEAILAKDQYRKVLYITIGTGIGGAFVIEGKLEPAFLDFEPGRTMLEHNGELKRWEDFTSGRALMEKYGKKAGEINDPEIWREFAYLLSLGLGQLLTIMMPDVVIIGGGVGAHMDKFKDILIEELQKFENDLIGTPEISQAKRPEEAVIYGCYDFIRQHN